MPVTYAAHRNPQREQATLFAGAVEYANSTSVEE